MVQEEGRYEVGAPLLTKDTERKSDSRPIVMLSEVGEKAEQRKEDRRAFKQRKRRVDEKEGLEA